MHTIQQQHTAGKRIYSRSDRSGRKSNKGEISSILLFSNCQWIISSTFRTLITGFVSSSKLESWTFVWFEPEGIVNPVARASVFRHVAVNRIDSSCGRRILQWIDNFECHIIAFCWDLQLFFCWNQWYSKVWFIIWIWCRLGALIISSLSEYPQMAGNNPFIASCLF
jgi:hypothetical protein